MAPLQPTGDVELPENPVCVARLHRNRVELYTGCGWLHLACDGTPDALAERINEHLAGAGVPFVVAVKVRSVDGKRQAWFEQMVAGADLDRAIAWPDTLVSGSPTTA